MSWTDVTTAAGVLLLFLVWITEVALVRELRKGREAQAHIRATMGRVQSALDALGDKIAIFVGRFKW